MVESSGGALTFMNSEVFCIIMRLYVCGIGYFIGACIGLLLGLCIAIAGVFVIALPFRYLFVFIYKGKNKHNARKK